jgi:DNA-binding MarR family transcriptional regulator
MVKSSAGGSAAHPEAVAAELRSAVLRISRRLRRERGRDDVTVGQHAILATLRDGPFTPGQLAESEQVRPPSITRTVAALEELGLVRRAPDPDDGRQVLISLTSDGRDLLVQTRRLRDKWLADLLEALAPAERQVLADAAQIMQRLSNM